MSSARSILVIEDDASIRECVSDLLAEWGYPVSVAANGLEGFDRLAAMESPGLIILDLMMPVVDGHEFLRLISSSARFKSIPVIVVSASLERPAQNVAQFIPKPFRIEALREAVKRHCGVAAEPGQAPARKRALAPAKVLVVDDEEIVRDVLTRLLEIDGDIVVTSAATAEDGLVQLGRGAFDVLVADKNLPGMDGVTLVREARHRQPGLEAILITAYGSAHALATAIEHGASDYLSKPFGDVATVRSKVKSALARRREHGSRRVWADELVRAAALALSGASGSRCEQLRRCLEEVQMPKVDRGAPVDFVGSAEVLSALRALGVPAEPMGGSAVSTTGIAVIELGQAGWLRHAEQLRTAGADVLVVTTRGTTITELLEALELRFASAGLDAVRGKLDALREQRAVERAQGELASALVAFQSSTAAA